MESTLSLKKSDFYAKVGFYLGYGRGADNSETAWTAAQLAQIKDCVDSGVRQFYFPAPVQGQASYDWSFLRPTATLALDSAASTVSLPDDFGGLEGALTVISTTNQVPWLIRVVNDALIDREYAEAPTQTGRPLQAAIRPKKGTDGQRGQRKELYVFPLADQAYTLTAHYYLLADALSDAFPFAYGGMEHAETILESCLAVAESRYDDQGQGPHSLKFQERLSASVHLDRRNKPQHLGYNRDGSEDWNFSRGDQHALGVGVTFNGTQY